MAQKNRASDQSNQHAVPEKSCPDCESGFEHLTLREFFTRREFVKTAACGVAAAGVVGLPNVIVRAAEAAGSLAKAAPETLVKQLYDSLTPEQSKSVAFDWDYVDKDRGLLRTRVSNNWNITKPTIASDFYTKDQQQMVRAIYEGLLSPDWIPKIDKQLTDDGKGYGKSQSIALFGKPGDGKFEFVMTGRHMTMRVDGHSAEHVAFGGPVFHGHAASGFNEKPDHPGNVFWPQAQAANKIYEMLDGRHRKLALQPTSPPEAEVGFRGAKGEFPGVPVTELTHDQREQLEKTLTIMLSPYRNVDHDDVMAALNKQGGLDKCSLAFYQDEDVGNDGVWDNWRLEGPSFVWYFRGSPHVHLWMNIADSPDVPINAQG
jgi:hypothetical protein